MKNGHPIKLKSTRSAWMILLTLLVPMRRLYHWTRDLSTLTLYPYQEQMFSHFNNNRFSIVLACRQSGKSISSVVYLLWYAIFHPEKTIAILANKGATAREMLGRVTLALGEPSVLSATR